LDWADITEAARLLSPHHLGLRRRELGVLAGGPPCQPFSKAAQWTKNGRSGLADPRARCLTPFVALAERFLPRVVLIEDVPGFIRGRTSAVQLLRRAFGRINRRHGTKYRVEWHVLNAADLGVPQRREGASVDHSSAARPFHWRVSLGQPASRN